MSPTTINILKTLEQMKKADDKIKNKEKKK